MNGKTTVGLIVCLSLVTLGLSACSSSNGGRSGNGDSPPWGTEDGHLERINLPTRDTLLDIAGRDDYGKGQTIAILSTDLGEDHTEFKDADGQSRISEASHREYDSSVPDGATNPGTAVASLAAGSTYGVARDATILGVGVVQPEGYRQTGGGFELTIKPEDMISGIIDYASKHNADVLAIHVAVTDTATQARDIGDAIWNAGAIAVIPTPTDFEPGVKITDEFNPATMARVLVVGEIAPDNSRPATSGMPADHNRDRFIVAPGDPVYAAFGNSSDDALYAGPFTAMGLVAGAAALLNSYYEDVTEQAPTPEAVTQRLLDTADRSFSGYDEDIHGQGVLDVGNSLTPIGTTSLAGMDDGLTVQGSRLQLGSAFGDALTEQEALSQALSFDSTGWPFLVDFTGRIQQQESWHLRRHMDRLANMGWQYGESTQDGGYRVTTGQSAGFSPDSYLRGYESMSLWANHGDWTMALQSHADPYLATAYEAMPELQGLRLMAGAPGAAHMASWREASGASLAWSADNTWTFGSRVWTGYDGESPYQSLDEAHRVHRAEVMALAQPRHNLTLGLDIARQQQSEGLFGTYGGAALQPGTGADTTATGVMVQWQVTEPLTLFSRYEHGWTEVAGTGGLISDFDSLQTQSALIGGVWQDGAANRWGLVYSQPLRVSSGDIQLTVPYALDDSGDVRFQHHTVSASPSGREQNFEMFLDMPLETLRGAFRLNLLYQLEPGHVADAPPAWAAAGGYQARF